MVRFVRELTDDVTRFGRITRSVELQFLYELPPENFEVTGVEVWSDDFESIPAFTAAVEALPEWKFAAEDDPSFGELLEDEEWDYSL